MTLPRRAALLATVLVLTGCTHIVAGHAKLASPRVGDPVTWEECRLVSGAKPKLPAGAECGKVAVPIDYEDPDGDVATLALLRFPATGKKIGSLLVNPGGPGESGIQAALNMLDELPTSIRERFDLVGFDPRGVSSSRPTVWCNTDEENDKERAESLVDYSEKGVELIDNDTKAYVQRCVDRNGKNFLANIGTVNVARDLDAIRAAVGDDKLTYLGYSYGTRIGSAYAEAYPQNVRAMILDGAIDPNADPMEEDLRQSAAFQKAFDDFAADCAKSEDCPLGTDPAKSVEVYHSLVDPLVKKPAKTKDPRGLSYNDAVVGTILSLYSPNFWSHLTDGLRELTKGRGDTLLLLADIYMNRDKNGHYTNATDARVAVNCVDKPPITDRAKAVEEDRRAREVAPFLSYGKFTGHAPMGVCAFWPVPPTSQPHTISVPSLPPTLVVSTTHDPATPYQAGVDLAKQLHAGLLTFEGTQHTVVFEGNDCVDKHAVAYLLDGKLPPAGAKC